MPTKTFAMAHRILLFLFFFSSFSGFSQVVINELDSDTPSTDDKEFIELKSLTPNYPLDNLVLVFYNGSTTSSAALRSYYTIDLDGLTTDVNGLILLGNNAVSPVPEYIFSTSIIQNGADAVALYSGSASDFPDFTLATSANLIDALAYDSSDPDAIELMALLNLSVQINENENGQGATQSVQRKPDGTYEVKNPTPGANNDGSGIAFNGIAISFTPNTTEFNEGASFTLSFTTQTPVTSDLSFSYSLNNGTFNAADFTGTTQVFIPAGTSTFSTLITLTDDALDEGDEQFRIKFGALPVGYNKLNDNIFVYVIDNDFTTSAWGTPLNPTYGIVPAQIPSGYYDSLEGKSGAELKLAIQAIIANPAVVREQNYGDVEFILKQVDQNPENSNQVWLMYVEQGRGKYKYQTTASNVGSWNREHIFPQSRGGFADGTSSTADGIAIYEATNADDILAGHADAHHIRAEDGPENSARSNRDYGLDYNGPAGNQSSWKGDVARSLFYMAVRYNALSLANGNLPDTTMGQLGDLASLLAWNDLDPSDDFEMNRNNLIYDWQMNRNPFIDYPELAQYVFGTQQSEIWHAALAIDEQNLQSVQLYPNPANHGIFVSGLSNGILELFSTTGSALGTHSFISGQEISIDLPSGMYLAKIASAGKVVYKKLIVR